VSRERDQLLQQAGIQSTEFSEDAFLLSKYYRAMAQILPTIDPSPQLREANAAVVAEREAAQRRLADSARAAEAEVATLRDEVWY
jgi:hypothetical protein